MIVVPKAIFSQLITEVHGNIMYGHEGQFKTKERILQSYWWPGMDQHINVLLQKCTKCQKTKCHIVTCVAKHLVTNKLPTRGMGETKHGLGAWQI